MFKQLSTKVLHHIIIFIFFKGLDVSVLSIETPTLSSQWLNKHSNSHTWWECMRIDDDIGSYPVLCEWHVLLRPQHWHHSLLSMSGGELITYHWVSRISDCVTKTRSILSGWLRTNQSHILHSCTLLVFEWGVFRFLSNCIVNTDFWVSIVQFTTNVWQPIWIQSLLP